MTVTDYETARRKAMALAVCDISKAIVDSEQHLTAMEWCHVLTQVTGKILESGLEEEWDASVVSEEG